MPSYKAERVEYWENSAIDGRIYDVAQAAPINATPPDEIDDRQEGCTGSDLPGSAS
jgi:hypothetical protein